MPYEPQGIAAAVGSAFDALIKAHIIKNSTIIDPAHVWSVVYNDLYSDKQKEEFKDLSLKELLFMSSVEAEHREEVREAGNMLMRKYINNGYNCCLL